MPRSPKSPTPVAFRFRYIERQLVARRQEPAADAVDVEVGAQMRGGAGLGARGQHVARVLPAGADGRAARAGDRAAEAAPLRAGALIERRGLEVAPAVGGVVRVDVEDEAAGRSDVAGRVLARRRATRSSRRRRDWPRGSTESSVIGARAAPPDSSRRARLGANHRDAAERASVGGRPSASASGRRADRARRPPSTSGHSAQ